MKPADGFARLPSGICRCARLPHTGREAAAPSGKPGASNSLLRSLAAANPATQTLASARPAEHPSVRFQSENLSASLQAPATWTCASARFASRGLLAIGASASRGGRLQRGALQGGLTGFTHFHLPTCIPSPVRAHVLPSMLGQWQVSDGQRLTASADCTLGFWVCTGIHPRNSRNPLGWFRQLERVSGHCAGVRAAAGICRRCR